MHWSPPTSFRGARQAGADRGGAVKQGDGRVGLGRADEDRLGYAGDVVGARSAAIRRRRKVRRTGASGAVTSIVTDSGTEATLTLPATSVVLAAMTWTPAAKALVVIDQVPAALA